jgi:hypothetical protein
MPQRPFTLGRTVLAVALTIMGCGRSEGGSPLGAAPVPPATLTGDRDAGKEAPPPPPMTSAAPAAAAPSNTSSTSEAQPQPAPSAGRASTLALNELVDSPNPADWQKARNILEPRVFARHGTDDDARLLKMICKAQRDAQCVAALKSEYPGL